MRSQRGHTVPASELITVVTVIRHGSRNPLKIYKIKFHENEIDRPEEVGLLTKEGKLEMYNLGIFFRKRYANFLCPDYSNKNFKMYSTGSERTLTSSQLFAAGLYPPTEKDTFKNDLNWHPIPIHVMSAYAMVGQPHEHFHKGYKEEFKKACEQCFEQHVEKDVVKFLSENIGEEITQLTDLLYLCDNCILAEYVNGKQPDWVHKVYPEPLMQFYRLYIKCCVYTNEMKKIYVGPFFDHLLDHMNKMTKNRCDSSKLLAFCAHDLNLHAIFHSLGITDFEWPSFGASITFELWKKNNSHFVNVYYKCKPDDVEPTAMILNGEEFDCDFDKFKNVLNDTVLSSETVMQNSFDNNILK